MTLFKLPKNVLYNIIFKLLDFDSIKALSNTCMEGLELFSAKLLTYDDKSHEVQDYRTKRLLYVIARSDQYFKNITIRNAVYSELLCAAQQCNVDVKIRCLQYFLLAILGNNVEHHQRFCMLIQIMGDDSSKLYACLYAKKFRIPDIELNLMGKIRQQRLANLREIIIHQVILMRSSIENMIQSRIIELSMNLGNDKSHVNFFLAESLQYVKFLIDVSETSSHSLMIDFGLLLPHLRNIDHVSELAKLLLILLRYQNNVPSYQCKIVVEILSSLIRPTLFSMYDGYAKNRITYIVSTLHRDFFEIVPFLNNEQLGELFFYFSGLSLYSETTQCNTGFLQHFSAEHPCVLGGGLQDRLSKINEQSSEAEILCLFSLVMIYPKQPHKKIDFLIGWFTEQFSILESPYDLKLLSTLSAYFNDAHTIGLYDRLCLQLKKHDVTNFDQLMEEMHRNVQTIANIRSSTDIVQSTVFRLLSMIYLRLDKARCEAITDLIVTVAYGKRFTAEYTPYQTPEVEVLSRLYSQLSTTSKAILLKKAMPNLSRNSFFLDESNMSKASPNCLPFLIDHGVFTTLLAMKIDVVQLPLLRYIDITKLTSDQVQLFIAKLDMMRDMSNAENSELYSLRKDQLHYILILKKFFSREQRILGAFYLTKVLGTYEMNTPVFLEIIDLVLTVFGPDEFIDMLYNNVFNLAYSCLQFCNQLTSNIFRVFAHENHTPAAWLAALLPRLSSLEFNCLHPTVMIIASMIRKNYIAVDCTFLRLFEQSVDYLLDMPQRHFQYYDLMITVSKHYGIFELIRWTKSILRKTKLSKGDFFYESDDAIMDAVKHFFVEFKISFSAILSLLNNASEDIVHLGYYYIGKSTPSLTLENLSAFYQHIERALNKKESIPDYIVSIFAYYQTPVHYQIISTIVLRLLLNCQNDQDNNIFSTYHFAKLMKPIFLSCNDDTVRKIHELMIKYMRDNYSSRSRNITLLSEFSELCDYASLNIESELACMPRMNN